jgi:hypothetical protein
MYSLNFWSSASFVEDAAGPDDVEDNDELVYVVDVSDGATSVEKVVGAEYEELLDVTTLIGIEVAERVVLDLDGDCCGALLVDGVAETLDELDVMDGILTIGETGVELATVVEETLLLVLA